MENIAPAPNPTKVATKWALIYVVVSIIITYTFQILNIDQNSPVKYVGYIPFIAFLFLAQKEYKDQLSGYLTFSQGFSAGFRYAVFSGLLLAVFIFIYLSFLSPQVLDQSLAAQQDALSQKGMSSEQIDKALEIGKKYGPIIDAFVAAVGTPIAGAIVALIGAAIFKKDPPPFIPEESYPTV